MTEHFNKLTPAQVERLSLLIEECAEVQQIACKILRHGYDSHHPEDRLKITNRTLLEMELGHVLAARDMLVDGKDLDDFNISDSRARKHRTVGQWLHHQRDAE